MPIIPNYHPQPSPPPYPGGGYFPTFNAATPNLGAASLAAVSTLASTPQIQYSYEVLRVGPIYQEVLEDLTGYIVRPSSSEMVKRTCTAEVQESCNFTIQKDLNWGADQVLISQLQRSDFFAAGAWQRFPLGVYVVTTPQVSLNSSAPNSVVGYGRNYLLQNSATDSFVCATGSTYSSTIIAVLIAAGFLPAGSTTFVDAGLHTVVNTSPSWFAKTTPIDLTYPMSDSTQWTYIKIINDLLKASGQRPLWADQNGQWWVSPLISSPSTQASQWVFARTNTAFAPPNWPYAAVTDASASVFKSDVYNVPNEWIFIQRGLSFNPTAFDGSDGRYRRDNFSTQPSDQTSIGRVITSVQYLNASGQADLVAQGDAIVALALAQAETLNPLVTTPWPCAWDYDVFQYTDDSLPRSNIRKVQAQTWQIPLDGSKMSWVANVVAPQ